jgi:hypothetical protein
MASAPGSPLAIRLWRYAKADFANAATIDRAPDAELALSAVFRDVIYCHVDLNSFCLVSLLSTPRTYWRLMIR